MAFPGNRVHSALMLHPNLKSGNFFFLVSFNWRVVYSIVMVASETLPELNDVTSMCSVTLNSGPTSPRVDL